MLASVTLLLLFAVGAISALPECLKNEGRKCKADPSLMSELPATKTQMDRMCRHMIQFLRCVNSNAEHCDSDEVQELTNYISYLENDFCNEDSQVYQSFVSRLPCMRESFGDVARQCEKKGRGSTGHSVLRILDFDSSDPSSSVTAECADYIFMSACFASSFQEECGGNLEATLVDAASKLNDLFKKCPRKTIEKFPSVLEALRVAVEVEEEINNSIKSRK